MTKRQAVEALDNSMRDIMGRRDRPFGGKIVVFGGDFRQVLPVVNHAWKQDCPLEVQDPVELRRWHLMHLHIAEWYRKATEDGLIDTMGRGHHD